MRKRADYGGLALVFAELTDGRPAWKEALEGWNVEQSVQVLEWQAEAEARGEARGKARGKAEAILQALRKRFSRALPADVEQAILATSNMEKLDHWLDNALSAPTMAAFRRLSGLLAANGKSAPRSKPTGPRRRRKT